MIAALCWRIYVAVWVIVLKAAIIIYDHLLIKAASIFSIGSVRRILKRKKYSYIWAKYSLEDKQDSEKRAEFQQKKRKIFNNCKGSSQNSAKSGFGTRIGFSLRVIRRKSWGKPGQRKQLTGQRRRGRVNV